MDELKVKITGSSAGFDKSLRDARSSTKQFAQEMAGFAKGAAIGFLSEEAIRQTLDFAGQVNDLSSRLGISTEAVQKWNYALKMSGADMGALAPFFTRLAVARGAAISGDEKMIENFRKLGVAVSDLKSKRLEDVGAMIAKTFQTGDAQNLIGAMSEVGGRGAGSMIAAFKDGFDELTQEASNLGIVIEDEIIKKLDAAGDRFASIAMQMRSGLAPVILWFGDRIQDVVDLIALSASAVGDLYYGNTAPGAPNATSSYIDSIVAREAKLAGGHQNITEAGDGQVSDKSDVKHARDLEKARAELAREVYNSATDQEKLNLLLEDEERIRSEIVEAENEMDEARATKLRAELMRKEREEKGIRNKLDKGGKSDSGFSFYEAPDALSKMGMFTEAGMNNYRLTESRIPQMTYDKIVQQIQVLKEIKEVLKNDTGQEDIWA